MNRRASGSETIAQFGTRAIGLALALGALLALGSCADEGPAAGGNDAFEAVDTLGGSSPLDALNPPDSLGSSDSIELLGALEAAAGTPTITITSPTSSLTLVKVGTTAVNQAVTTSVTDFVLGTEGKIEWLVDSTSKGVSTGTSFTFTDLPLGLHRLAARLIDNQGNPIAGSPAKASQVITITKACTTTAECDSNNACYVAQCLSSGTGKQCKFGPIGPIGGDGECCASDFDCKNNFKCPLEGANKNTCVACATTADCNDNSDCTIDSCNADGTCSNVKDSSKPNCCAADTDCDDGKACTTNICDLGTSTCNAPIPVENVNCCETVADCDATDPCRPPACLLNECRYGKIAGCCSKDADCNDNNPCTVNTCVLATNTCDFETKTSESCCVKASDCDDGKLSTLDACVQNQCQHTQDPEHPACDVLTQCPTKACFTATSCTDGGCVYAKQANCCLSAADCNDGDNCTTDLCTNNACSNVKIEKCCLLDSECNDNNTCTKDACLNNECRYGPDPAFPNCCTTNAGCDDKNACTVDVCTNNVCSNTPDANNAECCQYSVQCNDSNSCTNDACVDNKCVHTLAFSGCCLNDSECDDSQACTVDICDPKSHKCVFPKLTGACCTDGDCAPQDKCHKATCDIATTTCKQVPIDGTTCCTVDADCPEASSACGVAVCKSGVCHVDPAPGCCTQNSDCNDQSLCTDNICNTTTNECEYPFKEGIDPKTCQDCVYHADCANETYCDYDYCVSNKCVHVPKANCCELNGEKNGESCDDGNDCNIDACVFHRCRHFAPGALGPDIAPPESCCAIDTDCKSDGNACTNEVCQQGLCVSVASSSCVVPIPYKEPFTSVLNNDLSNVGFSFAEIGTTTTKRWSLSNLGSNFSTGYKLRYYSSIPELNQESCAMTPTINTGTASKLQVGWKGFFSLTSGNTPVELRVQMTKDGNWGSAQTLWSQTTTGSITGAPYQYEIASPSPFLGGKLVQLRFCVKTANTSGNWSWLVDDIFVVSGTAPVFVSTPFTQQVTIGTTKLVPIKAKDADGEALAFEIVDAPSFITLGAPYYYQGDATWNVTLKAAPAADPALAGQYPITVRVSDGILSKEMTFNLIVKYEGGYLVWAPEGTTAGAGEAIRDALHDLGAEAQIQRSLIYYSDLTKFKAVFGTLGVYPNTHVLSTGEANKLANFLNAGGNLYLEGGDTWKFDTQTTMHSLFKVTATQDGGKADTLKGYTVLDGKSWGYSSAPLINASIDQIEAQPVGGTVSFLRNEGAQNYGLVVAHDDSAAKYRTLASSVLFLGVTQTGTYTDLDLLTTYVDFFENGLPGCFNNSQCSDGNPCTTDSCVSGECTYVNSTATCDDSNACTTGDACVNGACVGTAVDPATFCTDSNPCTSDYCDTGTGCQHTPNTATCNDGNACTINDKCQGGTCVTGGTKNCNDGNVCTEDTQCNTTTGCVNAPKTGSCDDGNICTVGDACSSGNCAAGTSQKNCNDNNDCTLDTCDPQVTGGCVHTPVTSGTTCSDGNACTTGDHCDSSGTCVKSADKNCSDGKVCTDDSCIPASGCVNANNTLNCDDGNSCTENDKCSGGTCSGTQKSCPDDGNVCTTESCDETVGCKKTNNTANCNDGDSCTTSDKCSAGSCVGQAPKNCDDSNPCTLDSCNTTTGDCINTVQTGTSCDDGNACTSGDKCSSGGACLAGTVVKTCNDNNACTADSCNTSTGACTNSPLSSSTVCNDGDACTTGDHCNGSGSCVGGGPVNCDDSNTCTLDSCVAGACEYQPNTGATCDDGNKCTLTDKCGANGAQPTQCKGALNPCNDGNTCTSDGCNTSAAGDGCVHTNNTVSCDDGNPCTENDVCSGGTCQVGTAKNCDDGNVCTLDSCNSSGVCTYLNNDAHTETCYTGSAPTENVGLCHGGTKTCVNKVLSGCTGEVVPAAVEACDGVDDDCDGVTDEGCLPASMRFIIPSAIIKGNAAGGTIRGGLGQPLGGKAANGSGHTIHYGFYPTTVGQ